MTSKLKKSKFGWLIGTVCFVVLFVGLLLFIEFRPDCRSNEQYVADYREGFLANWGIDLPENMRKIYAKGTGNFVGDRFRYAVFEVNSDEFFSDGFAKGRNEKLEDYIAQKLPEKGGELRINHKYFPDFDKKYIWRTEEKDFRTEETIGGAAKWELSMIYFPEKSELVIYQYFKSSR